MKIKKQNSSLLKRVTLSYVLSVSVDIICFILLAFAGTMPLSLLLKLMFSAYFKKFICQMILMPVTCQLIYFLKRKEEVEIYDIETEFNPFSLENVYELNSFKKQEKEKSNRSSTRAMNHGI